jgi:hypothetical protein
VDGLLYTQVTCMESKCQVLDASSGHDTLSQNQLWFSDRARLYVFMEVTLLG